MYCVLACLESMLLFLWRHTEAEEKGNGIGTQPASHEHSCFNVARALQTQQYPVDWRCYSLRDESISMMFFRFCGLWPSDLPRWPLACPLNALFFVPLEEMSLAEQVRRIKDIEAIESDSFVPQAFKSSRDGTKVHLCLSPSLFSLPSFSHIYIFFYLISFCRVTFRLSANEMIAIISRLVCGTCPLELGLLKSIRPPVALTLSTESIIEEHSHSALKLHY